jgi:hypothetical protein
MRQCRYWETDNFSASREIYRLSWTPKVYYRVHKSPPLDPILIQMHPVHNPPPPRSILILSSLLHLGLPSGLFPSDFSPKILYEFLTCPIRATCPRPSQSSWLHDPNNIWWSVRYEAPHYTVFSIWLIFQTTQYSYYCTSVPTLLG